MQNNKSRENEFQEPEEKLEDYVNAEFIAKNPLDEAVNEKTYSKPNVNTEGIDLNQPIPEPIFVAPPIDFNKKPEDDISDKPKEKKPPLNPEMEDLPKKDKDMASDVLADMVLDGYSMLHMVANQALKIPEKKLLKMEQEGEINLSAQVPYELGKTMRASEFFQQYNIQSESTFSVSDEFKQEVKPVLTKVLQQKGMGITPEQQLLYMFGKDIAGKVFIGYAMISQRNQMMEYIKEATLNQRVQTSFTPPPPQPQPQPQPNVSSRDSDTKDSGLYQQPESVTTSASGSGIKPDLIVDGIPPRKKRGRPKN